MSLVFAAYVASERLPIVYLRINKTYQYRLLSWFYCIFGPVEVSTAIFTKLDEAIYDIAHNTDDNRYEALFIALIAALRPSGTQSATDKVQYLLEHLKADTHFRHALQRMMSYLFSHRNCFSLITRVGILSGPGFFAELSKQISYKVLPPMPDKRSLEYVFQKAFYQKKDYIWVQDVPDELWMQLFAYLSFSLTEDSALKDYLFEGLTVLSYRVLTLGLDEDMNRSITSDRQLTAPFLGQNHTIAAFIEAYRNNNAEQVNILISRALQLLDDCDKIADTIRTDSRKYGTSLSQTYLLVRTEQQIERIKYILLLLQNNDNKISKLRLSVALFKNIIESENKKHSIKRLFDKNVGLLAYQVAEHKGNTGEHYITTNRRQYAKFTVAAMGGGAVISVIAFIKALMHFIHPALFWQHFLYGLNYAIGFIALQVTHTTLATKQPGMTASTLASYLDERKHKTTSIYRVAHIFVLVWRSQTASFVGNLIIVFPMSYFMAYGYELIFGQHLADAATAHTYLNAQNPLITPAWVYAGITGVFLFISAIITGYVDNNVRFRHIPARVREHPLLSRILSGKSRERLGNYIDENLGGFAGNLALGFFLGFAPLIGIIFGIPFDIRHITISTANFAFGLCGLDNEVHAFELVSVIIGVLGIGFFNFLISFGLAFWVAIRSRGINIRNYISLVGLIVRYFIKFPLDFVRPPRRPRDIKKVYPEMDES